jgi:hypothetical protein
MQAFPGLLDVAHRLLRGALLALADEDLGDLPAALIDVDVRGFWQPGLGVHPWELVDYTPGELAQLRHQQQQHEQHPQDRPAVRQGAADPPRSVADFIADRDT